MYSLLSIVHIAISVILIVIVLMQTKQSMNLSGMFGGASQSALGSQPQSVLSKLTTVLAIVFMLLAVLFAIVPRSDDSILSPSSITEGRQQVPQGKQQQTPDQPGQGQQPAAPNEAPAGPEQ